MMLEDHGMVHGFGRVLGETGAVGGVPNLMGKGISLGGQAINKFAPKVAPYVDDFAQAVGSMGMRGGGTANKIAGGATSGAAIGRLLDEEGAGVGAGLGAVAPLPTRLAASMGRWVKDKSQPLYKSGQEDIVGGVLNDAAGQDYAKVIANLQESQPLIKGSFPTTGQAAGNTNISGIEQSIVNKGTDDANQLLNRARDNMSAREEALINVTPTREAAIEARTEATEELYDRAKDASVSLTPELNALFQRPSMQEAIKGAERAAAERGVKFDINNMTGRDAQLIKKSLDETIETAPQKGIGSFTKKDIRDTKTEYLQELEKQIPDYLEANKRFSELSRPVEQSEILGEILVKAKGTKENITPAAFIRQSTDALNKKRKDLAEVLSPEQFRTVKAIEKDLRMHNINVDAPKGGGSSTVKNLAYEEKLGNIGLGSNTTYSNPISAIVGGIAKKAGSMLSEGKNDQMKQLLIEALLDPKKAAKIMQNAKVSPKSAALGHLLETVNLKASQAVVSDTEGDVRKNMDAIQNAVSDGYDEWRKEYVKRK